MAAAGAVLPAKTQVLGPKYYTVSCAVYSLCDRPYNIYDTVFYTCHGFWDLIPHVWVFGPSGIGTE